MGSDEIELDCSDDEDSDDDSDEEDCADDDNSDDTEDDSLSDELEDDARSSVSRGRTSSARAMRPARRTVGTKKRMGEKRIERKKRRTVLRPEGAIERSRLLPNNKW